VPALRFRYKQFTTRSFSSEIVVIRSIFET